MTLSIAATPPAFSIFLQGLTLGLGLIVAIGSQNAFVLRQGLRREHVGAIVLFCALADAALIGAGVLGMAHALGQRPLLASALALGGAVFLAIYGWQALRRARRPQQLRAAEGGGGLGLVALLAQAAAFTLLNPHVYLDTVLLVEVLARSNRARCAAGLLLAPARPVCCGLLVWAMARAGWRHGLRGPAPGKCSMA